MFEQELYNYIANNFRVNGFELGFGFGDISEKVKAPYIIMYPLSNDGTRQVLCNTDDYTDGATSIQFSIYDPDYSNAMFIGRELDIFLASLHYLPSHRILINNNEVIRGFPNVNTGLSTETVTRYFTYTAWGNIPLAVQEGLLTANIHDILTAKE